jgi:nicotinate-nucleotide--dimethylbenzimidazole phosphoribosyltransferase
MVSGLPFDDMRALVREMPGPDRDAAKAAARISAAAGGLGRAAEIAEWLAAWTGRPPRVLRPVVALFAGTHGVAGGAEAPENRSVREFVERCAAGGAPVNQACVAGDLGLKIFDLALDVPTADITREAALDERAAAATIAFGMEAIAGGADLLVLGGYGAGGGSTAAAAMLAALLGAAPEGEGAGNGAVTAALDLHGAHLRDPLEALRRVGGREIAALAGAIVAARMQKVAVVLDGEAALAAAAVVAGLDPSGIAHCMAGDGGCSAVADAAAGRLGMRPILQLGMISGDAAGGAIAASVVKAAALVHAGAAELVARGAA